MARDATRVSHTATLRSYRLLAAYRTCEYDFFLALDEAIVADWFVLLDTVENSCLCGATVEACMRTHVATMVASTANGLSFPHA